jgi:D-lactate dehydrogenase (cytochrome)
MEAIVGPANLVSDADRLAPHLAEWRGLYRGAAPLMLMPRSAAEVGEVVKLCDANRIGVVPRGGNTGLVGGGVPCSSPASPQILLSLQRLSRIREVDADNFTVTAEAGCVLADVQQAALDVDRLFPLSLAAEGSCQLGGNISTNAGGINVLRYGTARELVLGLEVVLPDGRILDTLRGLRKDNTGYDLKQLFIGAEGTLGVITAATCKLYPRPRSVATAMVSIRDPEKAAALYAHARLALGDALIAFELISESALELVLRHIPGSRQPLSSPHPWYVLLETASQRAGIEADETMEEFLGSALEASVITDGVLARSSSQRDALWRLRHSISEAQKHVGAGIKHDISVPVSRVAEFLQKATPMAEKIVPGAQVIAFGHIGDGNIHFNLAAPKDMDADRFLDQWEPVTRTVHDLAVELGGSFSAEHGIGMLKMRELERLRRGVELDIMYVLKAALDPHGTMNPGKLLNVAPTSRAPIAPR